MSLYRNLEGLGRRKKTRCTERKLNDLYVEKKNHMRRIEERFSLEEI